MSQSTSAVSGASGPNAVHDEKQARRTHEQQRKILESALLILAGPQTPAAMYHLIAYVLDAAGIHDISSAHVNIKDIDPHALAVINSLLQTLHKTRRAEKRRMEDERREQRVKEGTYFDKKGVQFRELAKHMKRMGRPHSDEALLEFIHSTFSGTDTEKMSQLCKWLAQQRKSVAQSSSSTASSASSEDEPDAADADEEEQTQAAVSKSKGKKGAAKTKKARQPKAPRAASKSSSSSTSVSSDDAQDE